MSQPKYVETQKRTADGAVIYHKILGEGHKGRPACFVKSASGKYTKAGPAVKADAVATA